MKSIVLIVDDDDELREVIAEQLNTRSSEVLQARDGIEALELISKHNISLIVTDLQMPRLSGAALIKSVRGRGKTFPIFLMTGASEASDLDLKKIGATYYFRKPHDLLELCNKVKKTLASLEGQKLAAAN